MCGVLSYEINYVGIRLNIPADFTYKILYFKYSAVTRNKDSKQQICTISMRKGSALGISIIELLG